MSPAISLNIQHDRARVLVDRLGDSFAINDSPDALRVRVELPDSEIGRAAAADVGAGTLLGFSSEFRALEEENDVRGVRVVTGAVLEAIGLVDSPAYSKSTVEIRERIAGGAGVLDLVPFPAATAVVARAAAVALIRGALGLGDDAEGNEKAASTRSSRLRFGREIR